MCFVYYWISHPLAKIWGLVDFLIRIVVINISDCAYLQVHKCSGTWIVCHWRGWMSARDNDKLCLIRSDQFTCENWERFAHFGECWSLDNNIITSTMPTWHSWLPNWYKVLNYPLECNGTGSVLNWSIAAESKTLILSAESEVKKNWPAASRWTPAACTSLDI